MNPDAVVVAAGCYVQAQAEKQVIDPCIRHCNFKQ